MKALKNIKSPKALLLLYIQTRERYNQNIVALAEFAFAMIAVLEGINRDCFNDFKLRVGMCNGPLVAGNRPFIGEYFYILF